MTALLYPLRGYLLRSRYPTRFKVLDQLIDNRQRTPAQLLERQRRALTAVIAHASTHVPYYRTISRSDELQSLPLLSKEVVRRELDQLVDRRVDRTRLQIGHTGGSTGTPLAYYYDRDKIEWMMAGQYRSFMQCGWRPGEPILQLWGATQDISAHTTLRQRWKSLLDGERVIPTPDFDEVTLHRWSQTITSYQPAVIRGYPSVLAALAHYLVYQGIDMPDSIKGCFCTAETLYPQQRVVIESAFGCKLYNQYGCREIPNISCECRHGNQHLYSDLVRLESIEQAGEPQLVATSLCNHLMPLIRYQLGDSGQLLDETCDCGSPFPLMKMEVCRSNDLIQTPDGKVIYPSWFIHLLDGMTEIRQFRFIQTAMDRIRLQVVADHTLPTALEGQLRNRITTEMGEKVHFEIERVDAIARNRSGKHRFVCREFN